MLLLLTLVKILKMLAKRWYTLGKNKPLLVDTLQSSNPIMKLLGNILRTTLKRDFLQARKESIPKEQK